MPDETKTAFEHEIRIDARPETVFSFFTDPSRLVQWMGDHATLDPRPGGACRIDLNGAVVAGKFVQVEPPWRIVLMWGWEHELFGVAPESTAVEVSFTPDGDGTLLKLRHCRLPDDRAVHFHTAGWRHHLARLALAATGKDPGPDPFADPENVMRAVIAVADEAD